MGLIWLCTRMGVIMKVMFWHSTFCTHFHHIVLHKHTFFFMKIKIINDIKRCNTYFCKPQSSITLGDTILSLFCKFHNLLWQWEVQYSHFIISLFSLSKRMTIIFFTYALFSSSYLIYVLLLCRLILACEIWCISKSWMWTKKESHFLFWFYM